MYAAAGTAGFCAGAGGCAPSDAANTRVRKKARTELILLLKITQRGLSADYIDYADEPSFFRKQNV
jgi:hypothetical protein